MTAPDPLREFTAALPYKARQAFTPDYKTIPAIRALADRGDNLTDLAHRISRDLARRPRGDIQRLLTYRLLRAAGQLPNPEEEANT